MMAGYEQLEVHPLEIAQGLLVAVDDVVFRLLAAIDVEHLIALLGQIPETLLRSGLEQANQRLTFLLCGSFGELERLGVDEFLKARIECQRGKHCRFDGQPEEPEGGLGKADDSERSGAQSVNRNTAEA